MRTRLAVALAVGGFLAGLPGCVSLKRTPEARFFVLKSMADPQADTPAAPAADLVGVLPVLIPGYLDRPQIVTWAAPGELRIDEFLRWAEPLDSGVSRTLAENLDVLLPDRRLLRSPWPATTPLRCRIRVEIRQFGPQTSGDLRLEGSWAILPGRGERPLVTRAVDLRRPAPTPGKRPDAALGIEAMSRLLLDLAREIAAAIKDLPADRSD